MQAHTNPLFGRAAPGTLKPVQWRVMNVAAKFKADGHDTKQMSELARHLLSFLLHPDPRHRASAAAVCQVPLSRFAEVPLPACPIHLFL